jgi:hypothetical protein
MRSRWLLGNYLDPGFELSRADLSRISKLAHEKYLGRGAFIKFTAVFVLPPVLVVLLVLPRVLKAIGYAGDTLAHMIGLGLIVLAFWPWSAWAYGRIYARPFRRALRDLGHSVCLGCGYQRGGLSPGAVCPECGEAPEAPRDP